MNGRNHRTARVENKRDASREKRCTGTQRDPGGELFGQISVDRGEINPRLLKNFSFFENTSTAAAAPFALPAIFTKLETVELCYGVCNPVLQFSKIRFCMSAPIHWFHHTGTIIYN